MNYKIIFAIIILMLFGVTTHAKYTQTCKVKYKKEAGWSSYYQVEVDFLSGNELNNATNSFNYDSFSTYAVIFWDREEASIIEITSFLTCGQKVKKSCITNSLSNLEGKDQQGRKWEICVSGTCI